jgi:hypothetical protein
MYFMALALRLRSAAASYRDRKRQLVEAVRQGTLGVKVPGRNVLRGRSRRSTRTVSIDHAAWLLVVAAFAVESKIEAPLLGYRRRRANRSLAQTSRFGGTGATI